MTNFDLNALSLPELKQLAKDVAKAIAGYEDRKKAEVRAALDAQAKEMGYSLAELFGQPVTRQRAPAGPKYKHPENSAITWSGRGRRPQWFVDALANGTTEDDLAV